MVVSRGELTLFATTSREEGVAKQAHASEETTAAPAEETAGPTVALLRLQRSIGNAATTGLIQTKLMVGPDDDPLEREADRVADQVVGAAASASEVAVSRAPAVAARATAEAAPTGDVVGLEGGPAPAAAVDAIAKAGGGQPLPETLQRSMEAATGSDLSNVRVHTGAASDTAAQHLGARAFTTGSDVHFAAGQYDPSSTQGQKLLAHEVTHTIQQTGGGDVARSIQRMPSPAAVRSRTGRGRNEGKKVFGKVVGATTTYNNLLDALQAHSDYIVRTEVAKTPTHGMAQLASLGALIDRVSFAANAYLEKEGGEATVRELCLELVANAPLEKRVAADVLAHWLRNAHGIGGLGNAKWFTALPSDPTTYTFRAKDATPQSLTATGGSGGKGQNKEIKLVTNESGEEGVFANDDTTGKYEGEEWANPAWMLEMYGVKGDLKLGNRSIAMSRLDKLLDGGVIARTERGLLQDKLGTFQMKAKGEEMSKAASKGMETNDPTLARLLSRLQLIDIIAGQVDRHAGNYFVERDKGGKIVGVTGIDLDMAWGNDSGRIKFDIEGGTDKYPGFSRYVDKELAQRIIALDPNDLRTILLDLLEPAGVEAAVKRLVSLQQLLQDGMTQLLEPDEWTESIRAKIIDEKQTTGWKTSKSYFGRDQAK